MRSARRGPSVVAALVVAGSLVGSLAGSLAGASRARADCSASTRAYVALDKGLYLWDHDVSPTLLARLLETVRVHHFTEIYAYVGATQWDWSASYSKGVLPSEAALATLTTALRAAGVSVHGLYYLNDDPNDLSNAARVDDLVDATKAFSARHPAGKLDGLQGDQEPGEVAVYGAELAATARATTRAAGALAIDAALRPHWLHDLGPSGRPFFEDLLDVMPVGTLMDYTNVDPTARALADQVLTYADGTKATIEIALETGSSGAAAAETWNALVKSNPEAFRAEVVALDHAFRAHASFRRVVVHDFSQYFEALYGSAPDAMTAAIPTLCDDPAPTAGADASADADDGLDANAAHDAAVGEASDAATDAGSALEASPTDAATLDDAARLDGASTSPPSEAASSSMQGCGVATATPRESSPRGALATTALALLAFVRTRRRRA